MKAELSVALLNSEGRLISEVKQPSKSFVRSFISLLYVLHTYLKISEQDISNTARTLASTTSWSSLQLVSKGGGVTELVAGRRPDYGGGNIALTITGDYLGIQVGSGSTAPTPTNYALQTRIAHGQGAGQLVYVGCEVEPPVISAPNATMLIRRYFTNKSGGDVTVWEVGMYAAGMTSTATGYVFLICRDVLGAAITVANTQLLRVEYTLQVTV